MAPEVERFEGPKGEFTLSIPSDSIEHELAAAAQLVLSIIHCAEAVYLGAEH